MLNDDKEQERAVEEAGGGEMKPKHGILARVAEIPPRKKVMILIFAFVFGNVLGMLIRWWIG